jgi:hypothetical protein
LADGGASVAIPDSEAGPVADSGAGEEPALQPSNIPGDLLTAGTGELILRAAQGPFVIDTDRGTITNGAGDAVASEGVGFSTVNQPGAGHPALAVFSLRDLRVEAGATVQVEGGAALVIAAAQDIRIDGIIDATGGGIAPTVAGPGGFPGGTLDQPNGAGPGGGTGGPAAEDIDVGGGGGGHAVSGGPGGAAGASPGAAGGLAYGDATLSPLFGGSGGGIGGGDGPVNGNGRGGGGGGAVQLSAGASIRLGAAGAINCGGGGGEGGSEEDGGGGGGAGGAILLEARSIFVQGILAANGGGGGAGAEGNRRGAPGLTGGVGAEPALGGAGVQDGSSGGAGGATGSPAGAAGADARTDRAPDNAGGGGGSGGRILLRAGEVKQQGILSPAEGATTISL